MGRGVPLPNRGWAWGGGCAPLTKPPLPHQAPSPEKFLTFWLKIVHFGIYSDKNSQFSIVHVNSKYY